MTERGRVSVIIPARNEAHLQRTIDDVLAKAAGDVEVIPVLDGLIGDGKGGQMRQPVTDHPRVRPIYKDTPGGMRPAIMDGAHAATGEYLLKLDGHCILGDGYDEILKQHCDYDWMVTPTRHSIAYDAWTLKRRDFNYSILTYPFLASMYGPGFHSVTLGGSLNAQINTARADRVVDDIMGAQGSMWFQHRAYFLSFPPLDHDGLYFYQENQETTLRVVLSGGRAVICKATHYGHWHKGKENKGADGRPGRGFYLDLRKKRQSEERVVELCLTNAWPKQTRTFESFIDQHWWLIARVTDPRYAWPLDWREWQKHRAWFENRPPAEIPAHI